MINIGLDLAHSEVKMATDSNNISTVPCRVARSRAAQVAGYTRQRVKAVEFGSIVAYVGHGDELPTDTSMFAENWQTRAVVYAGLYDLLDAGDHTARVVVGLPVAPMLADDWRKTKKALLDWLTGLHTFTVSGKERSVHIANAIILPQPFGAYYDHLLAEDGKLRADRRNLFKLRVAVVDIGDNTLDLTAIEKGQPIEGMSAGYALGVSWAAAALEQAARQAGHVVSVEKCGAHIEAHLRGKAAVTTSGFDLAPLAQAAVDAWIAQVKNAVLRTWGEDHGAAVTLVAGGPARTIARELRYRSVTLADSRRPELSNVRGLTKFAKREVW